MASDFGVAKHGGPVEAAGAAYRRERATADQVATWRLRLRHRRLDRRDDDTSRARLRAVREELAWRERPEPT